MYVSGCVASRIAWRVAVQWKCSPLNVVGRQRQNLAIEIAAEKRRQYCTVLCRVTSPSPTKTQSAPASTSASPVPLILPAMRTYAVTTITTMQRSDPTISPDFDQLPSQNPLAICRLALQNWVVEYIPGCLVNILCRKNIITANNHHHKADIHLSRLTCSAPYPGQ
jgi:hypothetical protein